ncbi:hypothetical protein Rumeso_00879 [Rubellimicrobium mesophilum DSM 19309]|uniref:Uncharacterized protein n=1 Tax=Rubellimicrobium mesophilum DSM 19309 TaxID=442562 RepID=A0A017HT59_9RHOB|nr:hypothetical protein Rumeso_00879 [Rubellimicrobium mesophilum DSM 19309]
MPPAAFAAPVPTGVLIAAARARVMVATLRRAITVAAMTNRLAIIAATVEADPARSPRPAFKDPFAHPAIKLGFHPDLLGAHVDRDRRVALPLKGLHGRLHRGAGGDEGQRRLGGGLDGWRQSPRPGCGRKASEGDRRQENTLHSELLHWFNQVRHSVVVMRWAIALLIWR